MSSSSLYSELLSRPNSFISLEPPNFVHSLYKSADNSEHKAKQRQLSLIRRYYSAKGPPTTLHERWNACLETGWLCDCDEQQVPRVR